MKKVAIAVILVVIVAVLLAPGLVSAAGGGGWSWWWVNGPKVGTETTNLDVAEALSLVTVSEPSETEPWLPGESRTWDFQVINDADVALPGTLVVRTEGAYIAGDVIYYDASDNIIAQILRGEPPPQLIFEPGGNEITIQMTMDAKGYISSGTTMVYIDLYRGEVMEVVYDGGEAG